MMDVLKEIELKALAGHNSGNLTDAVLALSAIVGLAKRGQAERRQAEQMAAELSMAPASQSSVEIETRQKGTPAVKVKAYANDVTEAGNRAMAEYERLVQDFVRRVQEAAESVEVQ